MTNEEIKLLETVEAIVYWDGYNSESTTHFEGNKEICKQLREMINKYSSELTLEDVKAVINSPNKNKPKIEPKLLPERQSNDQS